MLVSLTLALVSLRHLLAVIEARPHVERVIFSANKRQRTGAYALARRTWIRSTVPA